MDQDPVLFLSAIRIMLISSSKVEANLGLLFSSHTLSPAALDALSMKPEPEQKANPEGTAEGYDTNNDTNVNREMKGIPQVIRFYGGAERDRTAGLLVANEALSQLSYSPTPSDFYILPAFPSLRHSCRRGDSG